MYAKPTCPLLLKLLVIIVIAIELVAIGSLIVQRTDAEGGSGEAPQQENAPMVIEPASNDDEPASDQPTGDDAQPTVEPVSLTVTFAGDCTLGGDFSAKSGKAFNSLYKEEGAAYFLQGVADTFKADDLTIVNMEGVLTDRTETSKKSYAFRGPIEYAAILGGSGVEGASVANNHSLDFGDEGFNDTIDALTANDVTAFGNGLVAQLEMKGVKVALIGVNLTSDSSDSATQQMLDNIAQVRSEGAQLVLVYMYWGTEKETVPQESDMRIARQAIDAGADVVVGTHPHVIQGYEVYQGRYIVYSLGNLSYGGNGNPDDKDCLLFQQTFTVTGDDVAKNDDVKFIPCTIPKNSFAPTVVEGEAADRVLGKLQASSDKIAEKAATL